MRFLFGVYVAGTVVMILMALSDFLFGAGNAKLFLKRALLCFGWPLAMLSGAGREVILSNIINPPKKEDVNDKRS